MARLAIGRMKEGKTDQMFKTEDNNFINRQWVCLLRKLITLYIAVTLNGPKLLDAGLLSPHPKGYVGPSKGLCKLWFSERVT